MTADTDPVSVIRELREVVDSLRHNSDNVLSYAKGVPLTITNQCEAALYRARTALARFDALFNLQQAEQASWAMKDGVFLPFKKVGR
jgi:hypothetical protein